MVDEIFEDVDDSFSKSEEALNRDLSKLRTGRANASLLDGIKVEYYGAPTPINQVATIKIPEPRMITITPWEKNMLSPIERAIQMSNLDINPSNDGALIRLAFPPLTGEVRDRLAKQARGLGEDAKIRVRNVRRDANEMLKALQKDGEISEDDLHRQLQNVQEKTDAATKRVDEIVDAKEKEIREV